MGSWSHFMDTNSSLTYLMYLSTVCLFVCLFFQTSVSSIISSNSFFVLLCFGLFHIGGFPQMPIYWTNKVLKVNWKLCMCGFSLGGFHCMVIGCEHSYFIGRLPNVNICKFFLWTPEKTHIISCQGCKNVIPGNYFPKKE